MINAEDEPAIEVVVFEGWCVGFRALGEKQVEQTWKAAKAEHERLGDEYRGRLGKLELNSVLFVNDKLREYDALTDAFHAFIHMLV